MIDRETLDMARDMVRRFIAADLPTAIVVLGGARNADEAETLLAATLTGGGADGAERARADNR